MTSPNQLCSVDVNGTKIYVTVDLGVAGAPGELPDQRAAGDATSAISPPAPRTAARSAPPTWPAWCATRSPPPQPRFFLADIVDIGFVGSDVAYVVSRGGDVVQRVVYERRRPHPGLAVNKQIDLNVTPAGSPGACQNPTGIAVAHDGGRAFVNCWGTRRLGVVDLSTQTLSTHRRVVGRSTTAERDAADGLHFFFTGRGRWSNNAWSSCGSCHPDGLSDNVTWIFAAGPRQTTSMDGTYSHGPGTQKQRIFNWTGIFDEMHDFERNTRGIPGGKGAVTRPDPNIAGAACGNLAQEAQIAISG